MCMCKSVCVRASVLFLGVSVCQWLVRRHAWVFECVSDVYAGMCMRVCVCVYVCVSDV